MPKFVWIGLIGCVATGASARNVEGKVDVTLNGDPVGCSAAKLVPRTPETERAIMEQFGTLNPAALPVSADVVRATAVRGPEPGSREVRCYDWRGYGTLFGFRFRNVRPGNYFVTLLARPKQDGRPDPNISTGNSS